MTDVLLFLADLRRNKINISLTEEEDQLLVKGNISLLNEKDKKFIADNKKELLKFLSTKNSKKYTPIPVIPEADNYMVSDAQRRLWILSQSEQSNISYNTYSYFELLGEYSVGHFNRAIYAVIERHEILRTVFRMNELDEIRQWVLESSTLDLKIEHKDLRQEVIPEVKVKEYIKTDSLLAFDLEKGPLFRIILFRLSDEKYVFYYNFHHIISDGWSISILIKDVLAYYNAFSSGVDASLPDLRIQYKDYSVWQRAFLKQETSIQSKNYWLNHLAGNLPLLNLPSFKNRPIIKTHNGRKLQYVFSPDGLINYNKHKGGSIFVGIVASLNILFYRYTNQKDILLGTPVAGRNHVDLENQIGFYVNTLVLRNEIIDSDSFDTFYDRVKQIMHKAYEYQDYPFDRLVEELNIEKDISRNAIFDIMVVLESASKDEGLPEILTNELNKLIDLGSSVSKFDLLFEFQEFESCFSLIVEYNEDIYDKEFVEQFIKHYCQLIEKIGLDPYKPLIEINFLTDIEFAGLSLLNNTASNYPNTKSIVDLVEEQVKKSPNNIALIFGDLELTYKELDQISNQLAHFLVKEFSIKNNDLVTVKLQRSDWLILVILGVLKSGAAYVPIDPEYPKARIDFIERDSNSKLIIDDRILRKFQKSSSSYSRESLKSLIKSDSLMYVIYTSGSTGNPKGCLLTHQNVVRLLVNEKHPFDFTNDDVWVLCHSIHFDFSVWEVFCPLVYGAKLVIPTEECRKDFKQLTALIFKHKVSIINQTPQSFRLLNEFILNYETNLDSLRYVIFGGDKLDATFLKKWCSYYATDKVKLINMYGITETTVHVSFYKITEEDIYNSFGKSIIGKPLPETEIYILNDANLLQPKGVVGEMYIGGTGLSKGYLNKLELTKEKFISNPYRPGSLMYKTGDFGRWLFDNTIEYIGRIDDQIKIRGYRIELGEIEYYLVTHKLIEQAIVLLNKGIDQENELIGYIVSNGSINTTELREYLKKYLPEYMIPYQYVRLDSLPLTNSGKINKSLLPIPNNLLMTSGTEYVKPKNDLESKLVKIWEEVLHRNKIGTNDNFFSLGGDSIKSMIMTNRIKKQINKSFSVDLLYKSQSISELSEILQSLDGDYNYLNTKLKKGLQFLENFEKIILKEDESKQILPLNKENIFPLSESELGMIYSSLLKPEEPIYYDQFGYSFVIPDLNKFIQSLKLLINKHPILRSLYYINTFTNPLKVILQDIHIPIDMEDLSHYSTQKQKEYLNNYLAKNNDIRYEFEGDLLWKIKVFKLNTNNECEIIWEVHHALLDGWSINMMLVEFSYLFLTKNRSKFAKLKTPYKNFQALLVTGENSESQKLYWKNLLKDYTRNRLPFNYNGYKINPDVRGMKKHTTSLKNIQLLTALDDLTVNHHVSFKSICLAAYLYLLRVICNETDIVTGVVSHNRPQILDSEKMLGNFLNTLPIRMHFDEVDNFKDLIEKIQLYLIDSHLNDMHLSEISKVIGDKTAGKNPIFDCIFNYTNFHSLENWNLDSPLEFGQFLLFDEDVISLNEMTNTLFDFEVNRLADELTISIKYVPSYFNDEDIELANKVYYRILESIVDDIDKKFSNINLISEKEQEELIYDFNSTQKKFDSDRTILDFFEEQVLKSPDSVALILNTKFMTYQELNSKSNKLAYILVKEGIQPGANIALISERTFDMIIGIYAILKVGGTYIPIDNEYPKDRQKYMIQNSSVSLILVDRKYPVLEDFNINEYFFINSYESENQDKGNLGLKVDSASLAYIIYTSGSTGVPKGVMIKHSAVVNLIQWVNNTFNVTEKDRLLLVTSISFDLSVYDIFGTLSVGATVVLTEKEEIHYIENIKDKLIKNRITFWNSVPSTMSYLVEELENDFIYEDLRIVFLSGDRVPVTLPNRIKKCFPNAKIISLGGATEATVWSNYYPIIETSSFGKSVPYGKPIQNSSFYILDQNLKPVPKGTVGELYIGGIGIAEGYVNDSEKSSIAFLPDPFTKDLGGRMYRTGDLGRMLANWNIEFLGRNDNQVKIRGFRVEVGEIESVILKSGYCEAVAIKAFPNSNGDFQLAAYLVCEEELMISEIKAFLSDYLPTYMIPDLYYRIDKIPLTYNGKINRNVLPIPVFTKKHTDLRLKTNLEIRVASIWSSLLNIEEITLDNDFFELGGTSLFIGAFINRVLKEFNVKLDIITVFNNSTLGKIAQVIKDSEKTNFATIEPVSLAENYPLSDAQRRLWVLSQFKESNISYNIFSFFELYGSFNKNAFYSAINSVIERHEILRTVFKMDENGEVRQWIIDITSFKIEIEHKDFRSEIDPEFAAETYVDLDSIVAFDLEKGPLFRAALLRISDDKYFFYYNMHHIISDGWSMDILTKEITAFYQAEIEGVKVKLPKLNIQYKDYTIWQLKALKQETYNINRQYWLKQLSGDLPSIDLPSFKKRPLIKNQRGRKIQCFLPSSYVVGFKNIVKLKGGTLFMGIIASMNALLYRYTGLNDILIGTPVSGREHIDLENQIGFYANTLVLRNYIDDSDSFNTLYERVKGVILEAFKHQHYPFDHLVDEIDVHRNLSRNVIFDIFISTQNSILDDIPNSCTEKIVIQDLGNSVCKFDLSFEFQEIGDVFSVLIEFNEDIYDKIIIEKFIENYCELLKVVGELPDLSLDKIEFISKVQTIELLEEFNSKATAFPVEKTVIDYFEEQVLQIPQGIALVFEDEMFTYRELSDLSNQLANYLLKNAREEEFIGICMERSHSTYISILGILKAGKAYVPLDSNLPSSRLNYIISDVGINTVLVKSNPSSSELINCKTINIDLIDWVYYKRNSINYSNVLKPIYIIYTSGSTGYPKGVLVEHNQVMNLIQSQIKEFKINTTDNILQFSDVSFDASVEQIFIALCSGAKLVGVSKNTLLDVFKMEELVLAHKITHLHATPQYLRSLSLKNTEFIKRVISGGDVFYPDIFDKIDVASIYNEYGPTETTVTCIQALLNKENTNSLSIIGRPIANTKIFILDKNCNLLPLGAIGEICIGGFGVARGYWNRPDLTANKFISNPFYKNEKLYKSGDLGRWLPDGTIEFIGRIDNQVKIRGYRIELGEIEYYLLQHPSIREAVVQSSIFNQELELVAYIVLNDSIDHGELKNFLHKHIPGYMIPLFFLELDVLPVTSNGKIDKKTLIQFFTAQALPSVEYIAPRNQTEQDLVEIWEEVLKQFGISIRDDFFKLGGHSLNAIVTVQAIYKKFNVKVSLVQFFENSTIEEIAKIIESLSKQNEVKTTNGTKRIVL
jgi:tyrocidine synthetase-3